VFQLATLAGRSATNFRYLGADQPLFDPA